ncbi:Rhodanese-like protein [Atractiella rhizophila]|nr:Rhodanese-like protein [Atractiella rhizophila]
MTETSDNRGIDSHLTLIRAGLKRLSPSSAHELSQSSQTLLIDIRPIESRQQHGVIPNAVIIDRNVLEWRLDPLSEWRLKIIDEYKDKEIPVVLFCNDGYASSLAAYSLRQIGLDGATDMDGGFNEWKRQGFTSQELRSNSPV